ncbi:MAG: hypothetical protein QF785_13575 [Phycisphaeraceae bacterium]|nr:hypothetical protein [Phycisphaeraceae bacterium]
MTQANTTPVSALPSGRIDVHCHLLPGIDDGCQNLDETFQCIEQLKAAGYIGSILTPHMWIGQYPKNTPENVQRWARDLREQLRLAKVGYHLWVGGELRLCKKVIKWCQKHGVPTVAESNCVLVDFWEQSWPRFADKAFDWLIEEGYQPILAHPERIQFNDKLEANLKQVQARGVMLQGNLRCMTGEEGFFPDKLVRQLLEEKRYALLALDAHGPYDLQGRLDGIKFVEDEFGADVVKQMLETAPRELLIESPKPPPDRSNDEAGGSGVI